MDAGTPASSRAVANLRALLNRFPESSVRLTVREATPAEHARLGGAPALVKRGPGPRALIFGTLDDAQPVLELLQLAGLVPAI